MAVEVKIPEVGESITEGFLAEWSQPDGALVATPLHTGINRVGQQDMALMEADWPGLEPA